MLVDVRRAIAARPRGTRLVVLSDFDGTLAEFDIDPAAPAIRPDAYAALIALSALSGVSLGLVSGRRVADLVRRVALPAEVYLAGLHGLEIWVDGRSWQHDAVATAAAAVGHLAVALTPIVEAEPGARLEPKGASVAVHVRSVDPHRRVELIRQADLIAGPWLTRKELRRIAGNHVVEYLPIAPWNKGDAVRWIRNDIEQTAGLVPWVVYFGDDITDEDAFREADVSVIVGPRDSAAHYRLHAPVDVARALTEVAATAAAESDR